MWNLLRRLSTRGRFSGEPILEILPASCSVTDKPCDGPPPSDLSVDQTCRTVPPKNYLLPTPGSTRLSSSPFPSSLVTRIDPPHRCARRDLTLTSSYHYHTLSPLRHGSSRRRRALSSCWTMGGLWWRWECWPGAPVITTFYLSADRRLGSTGRLPASEDHLLRTGRPS